MMSLILALLVQQAPQLSPPDHTDHSAAGTHMTVAIKRALPRTCGGISYNYVGRYWVGSLDQPRAPLCAEIAKIKGKVGVRFTAIAPAQVSIIDDRAR